MGRFRIIVSTMCYLHAAYIARILKEKKINYNKLHSASSLCFYIHRGIVELKEVYNSPTITLLWMNYEQKVNSYKLHINSHGYIYLYAVW